MLTWSASRRFAFIPDSGLVWHCILHLDTVGGMRCHACDLHAMHVTEDGDFWALTEFGLTRRRPS
jgi:hypothetical protein